MSAPKNNIYWMVYAMSYECQKVDWIINFSSSWETCVMLLISYTAKSYKKL